ncbi:hypothetical protein [Acidovorax sp. LjRoot117]|uniref:hypothetical protein n=1 Tax=Acidovorax sp. LjRoot117 TaxID=3342255 RepID=UPI003ECF1372
MAKDVFWTPERAALLGTAADAQIARIVGRSITSIRDARQRHGIRPFCTPYQLTPAQVGQLGNKPDKALASDWGCAPSAVAMWRYARGISAFQTQKAWTEAEIALLGTLSDAAVAQRVGRSRAAVTAMRRSRGVACSAVSLPHPHLEDIKRDYTTTLATVSEIAKRYGVDTQFITKRARKRGWTRPK